MAQDVKVIDFKKRDKHQQWAEAFRSKLYDIKFWFDENRELVMFFGPVTIGAGTAIVKAVSKRSKLKKETDLKELYCYDRSLGHYWKLRRELTNSEWVAIDKRKKNGERLADILSELKVLK